MRRDYDRHTGRPLADGREVIDALTDEELEAEVTIAAAEPRHRARRLEDLLLERARRSRRGEPKTA